MGSFDFLNREGVSPVPRRTALALCLALLPLSLLLFRGLGATDLRNDEAIYAYAAESILETGDWLTPRASISDRPYTSKPPLKFWLVAAGVRLGLIDRDERGLRTFDAVFASLALLYVFWIGVRLVDPVAGFGAAFLLLLQPSLVFHHGLRAGAMESILVLQFSASVYHLLAWSRSEDRRGRAIHIFILAAWQAFAVLAKPTALMVPVALAPMVLIDSDWRRGLWRDRWLWAAGIALAITLIAPWFVMQTLRRDTFWQSFFGREMAQRFSEGLDPRHLQPWHFYPSFLYRELVSSGALPWVAIGALLWSWRVVRRRWSEGILVLLWILVPLVLLSTSASKLRHYLYPSLPAVALFGGLALSVLAGIVESLGERLFGGRLSPDHSPRPVETRAVAAAGLFLLVAGIAVASGVDHRLPIAGWWIGCACLALAATRRRGFIVATVVVFFALWPWSSTRAVGERLGERRAPLTAVRQCVDTLGAEVFLGNDLKGSLFYIDGISRDTLGHPYFYYFRHLDRWQMQSKPDPALLYFRLFVQGHQAPTLMPGDAYRAFLESAASERARAAAADLLVKVRSAGMPGELPDPLSLPLPPALRTSRETVLLLPGPYSVCAAQAVAAGGELFDGPGASPTPR